MSNNKNKSYVVLPGGLTCKKVNPYQMSNVTPMVGLNNFESYHKYEENNPVLALTEVMPEGETFEGSEVLQCRNKYEWCDEPEDFIWRIVTTEPEVSCAFETRIAIKPLKAIEPVKICPTCKKGKDFQFCSNAFHIIPYVDEVVDVVENKETVDIDSLYDAVKKNLHWDKSDEASPYSNGYVHGAMFGAHWQQSQSIEGIVGFVLEWVAKKSATELLSANEILNMKSDIIKEYNNGK